MTEETTPIEDDAQRFGAGPWLPLTLAYPVALSSLGDAQFAAVVVGQAIPHTAEARWPTTASSLDAVTPYAVATMRPAGVQSALVELEPLFAPRSYALITLHRGTVFVRIAAGESHLIGEIEDWLRELFPVLQVSERRAVPVRFWTCGTHGANAVSRLIDVPAFDDVHSNYPPAVCERLEPLLTPEFQPAEGGQLILWYGPPGTGKTYALRALGWEWRDWCELDYVIDPEVFFGQRADYMVDVLLETEGLSALEEIQVDRGRKWRLLVLEDTGELLAADAKERTGQGLSRLLNLVDGIMGQGLRVLVLVTTNEPLRRLHPAVARPGRCAARVEFAPFAGVEAAAWLRARGYRGDSVGSATLAELFARLRGHEPEPELPVGFAP